MTIAPLILALVSDLFFVVQIEQVARALGYDLRRIESGDELEPGLEPEHATSPARAYLSEPLSGRGSVFIARLAEWQPALIIVELSSQKIPWADWIAAAKASAATRRIPVLAFGPHTDLDMRSRALDAGADAVVAKSRLTSALPELIDKYARHKDQAGMATDCQGEISALAREGIGLFNRGEYYDAHEVLEHAWMEESGPVRDMYRGILQVAVAYLQIERGNYRGAVKMFLRMRQWLDPLPDECRGINIAQLRADALAARASLEALGPERLAEFDRSLFRPLTLPDE